MRACWDVSKTLAINAVSSMTNWAHVRLMRLYQMSVSSPALQPEEPTTNVCMQEGVVLAGPK